MTFAAALFKLTPMRFVFLLLMVIGLSACAFSADKAGRIPVDTTPLDPSDAALKQNIQSFLKEQGAPLHSTYNFARVDLNDDGRRDAIVLLQLPYGYWCDMNGCTALVWEAHDTDFTLINAIQPLREPVYVSQKKTHGWRNIITRVSGRWDKAKDVALPFNGTCYPENPATVPPYQDAFRDEALRIFYR